MITAIVGEGATEEARIRALLTTGAAVAAVAGATPAGGTGATEGAYDTAANRNILIATVAELKAQLNALLVVLRAQKVIAE